MHEMAIAQGVLEMAEETARSQGCNRLLSVTVHCGQISGVMPDALEMAFHALVANTIHQAARLHIVILPLRLRCPFCSATFGGEDKLAIYLPCPQCGEELGHIVEQGAELLLAQVEAIP